MLDGVYACGEEGAAPVFVPAPPLRDDDVQRIVETAAHRLVRLLQQRGVLDEAAGDALAQQEPLLAALSAASIQGQLAMEPRAGHQVRRLLSDPSAGLRSGPLCFSARGFSLHAATRIEAEDRTGLERLCRYVTRPPLAAGRLQCIDTDHLTFRRKNPWSDGTTHLLLSPLELMEKLAASSHRPASKSADPPTRCIENPLLQPAGPLLSRPLAGHALKSGRLKRATGGKRDEHTTKSLDPEN